METTDNDVEASKPPTSAATDTAAEPPGRGGIGGNLAGPDDPKPPPYSVFTGRQKQWILFAAAFAAAFSTVSSYVYFPALVPMARDLGVSVALVNLTVTSYLVVAGVAPAFMGDVADQSGRRPAYVVMFVLMVASNVGLALQKSYPALFVLRMVQSAGSSGTYGAAYGVISDITTSRDRGSSVGILLAFSSQAPSFGPVLGGALAHTLGWRWIFWLLAILTGTHFLALLLFLPETQRKIVGNGSIPARGIYRSLFPIFMSPSQLQPQSGDAALTTRKRHHIPNPFSCIPMLFDRGNISVILIGSITYAVKMTLQASLGEQCIEIYGLNYLQGGLIYLPSGIGGSLASYGTGKYLDWQYKRVAARLDQNPSLRQANDITDFPIEKARLSGIYVLAFSSAVGIAGYGLGLMTRTHISVALVMQFVTGFATSSIFTMCGTLLSDLNPTRSATVQASYNLVRCLGAGATIGILKPFINRAGVGWCFGFYALLLLFIFPLAWILQRSGPSWRRTAVAEALGNVVERGDGSESPIEK